MSIDDQGRQGAVVDLIGRTGSTQLQVGYLDDIKPVAWVAMASFSGDRHVTGSGLSLGDALWELAERLVDGGTCQHCGKPTSLLKDADIDGSPWSVALSAATCVYSYRDDAIKPGCQP